MNTHSAWWAYLFVGLLNLTTALDDKKLFVGETFLIGLSPKKTGRNSWEHAQTAVNESQWVDLWTDEVVYS